MPGSGNRSSQDRRTSLEARDWIVRLTSGDVSRDEVARFRSWLDASAAHAEAFETERAFWRDLGALGRPQPAAPASARSGVTRRRAILAGAGAVAATGLIAVPKLSLWWRADYWSAVGGSQDVALPDGSVVHLNTDSAIAVDFRPELRLVRLLKGEAQFEVQADRPSRFRVATLEGNSDALAANFSVRAIDGVATVVSQDGVVAVNCPAPPWDAEERAAGRVVLQANQRTSYAEGGAPEPASAADVAAALAWRRRRIVFEGAPFSKAIAELGRYVPEKIVVAASGRDDVPVSAVFNTQEAVAAVGTLARLQGLSVTRIPGVLLLVS